MRRKLLSKRKIVRDICCAAIIPVSLFSLLFVLGIWVLFSDKHSSFMSIVTLIVGLILFAGGVLYELHKVRLALSVTPKISKETLSVYAPTRRSVRLHFVSGRIVHVAAPFLPYKKGTRLYIVDYHLLGGETLSYPCDKYDLDDELTSLVVDNTFGK